MDQSRMRKLRATLHEINMLAEEMSELTDEELKNKTVEFKNRLRLGESLDDLLPEAYAVVREADKRVLGMFPYDVQVLGAIVLHQGNVAEMRTGEGKTLTATLPLYLNGLTGKGAMLVTPSDYLAIRDFKEMSPVYRFLGLTVSVGVFENPKKKVKATEKRKIYNSDIIYTTNNSLGFDYLIHNLASDEDSQYMRGFHYAVLDEVDAVLLDIAQTPLVISGTPRVQSNLYAAADKFITTLTRNESYYFDPERKEIWLTQRGIDEAERYFNVENLFDPQYTELYRHIILAIRAHFTMESGKEYLVEDDEVLLLDQANGRTLEGTKLQGGLHQAIEAKEHVPLTEETRAMASITYQSLFLMFEKLSGMTGTGKTVETEFIETYNMEVIEIPTHRPVIRKDYPDKIYTTLPEKITASIDYLKSIYRTGQPVLLVTGSVRMSELYSEILLFEGVPHSLLNAFNAAKEAEMVAEAGQLGAVTVATNMAGRGTDIKLGPGVAELGGLVIIGTERMKNKRMDLQIRGRAGRQGDPGVSQFFVSLEDDLLISSGGKWVHDYFKKHKDSIDPDSPKLLTHKKFARALEHAQESSENQSRGSRGSTLSFEESIKVQRDLIYKERDSIIAGLNSRIHLEEMLIQAIDDFLIHEENIEPFHVQRFILDNIDYGFKGKVLNMRNKKEFRAFLVDVLNQNLTAKKQFIKEENDFNSLVRVSVLRAVDEAWIENVDYLQQLRVLISGRQSSGQNPLFAYHKEAYLSFEKMRRNIRSKVLQYVMLTEVTYNKNGDLEIYFG